MRRQESISSKIDWTTIVLYIALVVFGWLNIYAATYDSSQSVAIFDLSANSGKQLIFIGISIVLAVSILMIDFRFFDTFSYLFYGLIILLLIGTLLFARDINGAKSWLEIGGLRFQPSELAKIATILALAKVISSNTFRPSSIFELSKAFMIILVPVGLIILQKDAGTALVFIGLILVLYREGMTPFPLIVGIVSLILFALNILLSSTQLWIFLGSIFLVSMLFVRKSLKGIMLVVAGFVIIIGFLFSVDYLMNDVLKPHQKDRIQLVFNPNSDPMGKGWNLTQSKIAIGSGGMYGKGYLKGTQTKYDFVPEQSTDFIFCTIGEEHGFAGSSILVILFVALLLRLVQLAERQKWRFARVYGYGVVCILFVHFMVNIGMTMGLVPVIGIPLPFFSYGGSSLISFTTMLFIFLNFDAHKNQMLEH